MRLLRVLVQASIILNEPMFQTGGQIVAGATSQDAECIPSALRQQELAPENVDFASNADREASIPPRITTLIQRLPEEAADPIQRMAAKLTTNCFIVVPVEAGPAEACISSIQS